MTHMPVSLKQVEEPFQQYGNFRETKGGRRASKAKPPQVRQRCYAWNARWRVRRRIERIARLLIVLSVLCRKRGEILRQLRLRENRGGFANRNASTAVNAVYGVDVELRDFRKFGFVLARMNAINRTNFDAFLILCATFNDDKSHESFLLE
jgi:hypothetical protein